jgi:hypothetical protein
VVQTARHCRHEISDCLEQLFAVTERDAELLKICFAQLRQDVGVDVVRANRLFVALQA